MPPPKSAPPMSSRCRTNPHTRSPSWPATKTALGRDFWSGVAAEAPVDTGGGAALPALRRRVGHGTWRSHWACPLGPWTAKQRGHSNVSACNKHRSGCSACTNTAARARPPMRPDDQAAALDVLPPTARPEATSAFRRHDPTKTASPSGTARGTHRGRGTLRRPSPERPKGCSLKPRTPP